LPARGPSASGRVLLRGKRPRHADHRRGAPGLPRVLEYEPRRGDDHVDDGPPAIPGRGHARPVRRHGMTTIVGSAAGGLAQSQAMMDTVANNLANVNTPAFKRFRAL